MRRQSFIQQRLLYYYNVEVRNFPTNKIYLPVAFNRLIDKMKYKKKRAS